MHTYQNFSDAITSCTGKEIFEQLNSSAWNSPLIKAINGDAVAIGTDIGLRRKRNEDRLTVARVTTLGGRDLTVAIVCDGVGSSEFGDSAAVLAIVGFLDLLVKTKSKNSLSVILDEVIRGTDNFVRNILNGRGVTTFSVLLASAENEVFFTNIGDSRIYAWNPNQSLIEQLSVDDTLDNELKDFLHKNSSFLDERGLRGSLSQALGEAGRSSKDLRIIIKENMFIRNNGVILASDGGWKSNNKGFDLILKNSTTAMTAVRRVIASANWFGGIDNTSIIAIENISSFLNIFKNDKIATTNGKITFLSHENICIIRGNSLHTNPESVEKKKSQAAERLAAKQRQKRKDLKMEKTLFDNYHVEDSPEIKEDRLSEKRFKIEISTKDKKDT